MAELVKGVALRRAGEFLEKAEVQYFDMYLLAAWDGTEVVRLELPAGKRFGLYPQAGWSALECVYVLRGQAVCEESSPAVILQPGDYLAGSPVQEPCILRAVTDATLLYLSSQPSFHQVSGQTKYLQDLAIAVELKDGYTADHCKRIQDLSLRVGRYLHLDPVRQYNLFHGAFLHDLGKVAIPDHVLFKPDRLTPEEWEIMKQHPITGGRMLANTAFASAATVLEQHHERLDGSGYPLGLTGDAICLEAQIVAVVDSYDAMTSDRVYRKGMDHERAMEELEKGAGRLYNPLVVEAFRRVINDLKEMGVA